MLAFSLFFLFLFFFSFFSRDMKSAMRLVPSQPQKQHQTQSNQSATMSAAVDSTLVVEHLSQQRQKELEQTAAAAAVFIRLQIAPSTHRLPLHSLYLILILLFSF
jgi:hypothetical protein